jgi:acyl-CoA hydrolase
METLRSPREAVDKIIDRVGKRLSIATPLGIGKPNHLLNEVYRRARADATLDVVIHTALTLTKPKARNDLERRLLDPIVARLFDGYPELEYELDRVAGRLPPNVRVIEFYFQAGKYLGNVGAQRDYVSTNYTHVARDLAARGVNVLMQQVSAGVVRGRPLLSLSANADVTPDLVESMRAEERQGRPVAIVAQLNDQLPFMHGEALVPPDTFDYVVDDPEGHHPLFAPPKTTVGDADNMIGLYASALVKDGGEIQIGIGALGDAVAYALKLRHERNDDYRAILGGIGALSRFGSAIDTIGAVRPFDQGLFSATEMLVDGFMHLFDARILKRRVYDDVALQRLANEGAIGNRVTIDLIDLLSARGAIQRVLTAKDASYLQHFGILRDEVGYAGERLVAPDGHAFVPDLGDPEARRLIQDHCLGDVLEEGAVVHAGFFVGPHAFYQWLRNLSEADRKLIAMRRVTRINQLYGHEEIDRLHRRDARFCNTAMMMTMLGAAVSDALADERVVSGVGGQYNFVAMAHELPGGRSVLQVRSTRLERGTLRSNLVWSYGHTTIPRHLRDIVISEYGIADLRGKTDEECVVAMLAIADSRFQNELLSQAKAAGKLRADYRIPEIHQKNLPEIYARPLKAWKARGLFPRYPFGTDLTDVEQKLAQALERLAARTVTRRGLAEALADSLKNGGVAPDVEPHLRRLELHAPKTPTEFVYQRLVAAALRER